MYDLASVSKVHLEVSSLCNAACPGCPRNYHGYPFNSGYVERNLSLEEVKKIFEPELIQQLKTLLINGNYGDIVMNPEAVEIVEYFRQHNTDLHIAISTNAGARDSNFWRRLAELNTCVFFCIDGLEDTHSLYRQNTLYSTVIKNAQTFIATGGHAVWKFIPFDHNRHQINDAQRISTEMGFSSFVVTDYGRGDTPVFNKNKELTHIIGRPKWTKFGEVPLTRDEFNPEWQKFKKVKKPISCEVMQDKEIYISSEGRAYPCCYVGNSVMNNQHPRHQQVRAIEQENSALEYGLEHSIKWFNTIKESWSADSFASGQLIVCSDTCGKKS
jgi:MoaA/NifB/PqqE/SkfB family radical SAM enzyme